MTGVLRAQQGADGPASAGRTAEKLKALHDEADQLTRRERGLLDQLRQLELKRQIANEELDQADAAAAQTARDIETIDGRVAALERERDAERPKVASRLVELYKLGRGQYTRLLLSTSELKQLGQASRTVAALAAQDRDRVRSYEERLTELSSSKETLAARHRELAARRSAAVQARAAAATAIASQNALVREIDQRRDLNAQLTSELLAAQQKLDATIRDAGGAGKDKSSAPEAGAADSAVATGALRGGLPWPVTGPLLRRSSAAGGRALAAQRPGIEIQAAEGTSVQAVRDGTVVYAGSFDGFGNLVIVDHGAQTFSLYGYLLGMAVGRGVHVQEHQTVGTVGSSPTGVSALYFELRVGGRPVDPVTWLERSR